VRGLAAALALTLLLACGEPSGAPADVPRDGGGDGGGDVAGDVDTRDGGSGSSDLDAPEPQDSAGEAETVASESPWRERAWLPPGDLHDLGGQSFDDLIAVGDGGALLWWNGRYFQPLDAGTDRDLFGVDGRDGRWVVAGGGAALLVRDGDEGFAAAAIEAGHGLRDAVVLDDGTIYAVGQGGRILRLGDEGPVEEGSNTGSTLYRVWGARAEDLFAAGAAGGVLRRMGDTWIRQQIAEGSVDLRGIAGVDPFHVVVVGDRGRLLHYDGLGWYGKVSNDLAERDLRSVHAVSAAEMWAVGRSGVVLRYAGQTVGNEKWTQVALEGLAARGADLEAVFVESSAGDARGLIVGAGAVVLVNQGDGWTDGVAGPDRTLRAARRLSDGRVLAVGDDGLVARIDGARPLGLGFPEAVDLRALAEAPDGGGLLLGGRGALYRARPGEPGWDTLPLGVDRAVRAISWPVLVGEAGLMGRLDATAAFVTLDAGTSEHLEAACHDGDGRAWIAGEAGTLLVLEGDTPRALPVPGLADLRALAPWRGRVWAAGDHGVVLSSDGVEVVIERQEPGAFWYAALVDADDRLWLGGFGGRVRRYDGEAWLGIDLPRAATVHAFTDDGLGGLYAVGLDGAIFHLPRDLEENP
jgi:photosystem II stability/assembly factor-like uncharacterized protein